MTATATTNWMNGSTPTQMPCATCTVWISMAPALSLRLSAVNSSKRPFWMMIERPKVTSSGGKMSSPSVKLSSPRCSA